MLSNKQMAQYDGTTWTFATLDIDTALTYDVGTCFVSYNSQIRWFGGNTHPKIQVELDKSLVDGYDYVAYQLTALKYNFKEGCAIVTYPGITNSFSGRWNETNIDVTKIKSIHLLGTSQTGKDSASTPVAYKRYHRIVQDTYIGNIDNGDTYYTTT